jgi:hypothetical protein
MDREPIWNPRASLGFAFRGQRLTTRVGLSFDIFTGRANGAAGSLEVSVQWPVNQSSTKASVRASIGQGEGNGTASSGEGMLLMAGPRLAFDWLELGADAVLVVGGGERSAGLLVNTGLVERPGKYAIATGAVGSVLAAILVIVAYRDPQFH